MQLWSTVFAFLLFGAVTLVYCAKPPHVVLIMPDDLGWGDVSFLGSRQIHTPTLDQLASEGIVLTQHYSEGFCTPSRAALMTGRYPLRTGLHHAVISAGTRKAIPLNNTLLPEYMKGLGYRTHALGKWHLGNFNNEYIPTKRGFDTFLGPHLSSLDHFDHVAYNNMAGVRGKDWKNESNGEITYLDDDFGIHTSKLINEEAQRIIRSVSDDEKMFLYLPYIVPHSGNNRDPLQPEPEDAYGSDPNVWDPRRRAYAGMVKSLDNGVKVIVDTLEECGMLKDTVLVFFSDNGASVNGLIFDNNWGSNAPFRGLKTQLWEGAIRTPAFVWGKKVKKGRISNDLMHITDWLPTLVEAAGGDVNSLGDIDGVSHWRSFTTSAPMAARTEVLHGLSPLLGGVSYRKNSIKYLSNPGSFFPGNNGWYTPPEVLNTTVPLVPEDYTPLFEVDCLSVPLPPNENDCFNALGENKCLYDLALDPCERHNVIDDPSYAAALADILDSIRPYCEEQAPVQNPPFDPVSDPALSNYYWVPWTNDPKLPPGLIRDCSNIL